MATCRCRLGRRWEALRGATWRRYRLSRWWRDVMALRGREGEAAAVGGMLSAGREGRGAFVGARRLWAVIGYKLRMAKLT